MSQFQKFLVTLLSGQSDSTVDFEALCSTLNFVMASPEQIGVLQTAFS
jgi:hypothetical protein